ncbi:LacI family DNA-binding transcriptional regulator [Agrobacterium salinitolerans]|jgi:DNA-binding LacI/PurR family transcriptional regulator|uniref:LacI family DNA-binding transcriptional regulator n=1 Tax=Agrobacterium salinitolerans TaxID=1183413 RepID=A0A9X3R0W4_9HYPH|nr:MULTISPECIES: LacI family DNA-binding transcriptional regulator [Agrobacterium]MCZ7852558.1 LacI family DNA-binding transcriptional regulator [Agrobacterium salinitolerans]MCZ7858050.1 LacI family DNA-binding transcriptional regulator [Agrobacterium salinitolerans]MCZ7893645.1 LacI family DNA-binding transcriptional regulator [Agrobacterium salinitolerans]MCZ7938305.1 LacI family DNA-binding transcriptional regulator [Agrobacterium salinitolerans]MCZ7976205.1 LacI family DNA-binding transcr
MEEFSEFVGFSRPTVSKYFNDPSSVRKKTRDTIEEALRKSGFRPNMFAVNLNRRRSNIIGIVIPNYADPFYMALTNRIESIANDAGFLAFVLSSDGKPEIEDRAIRTFKSMNIAGAIIAPLGVTSHCSTLEQLAATIPIVYVDSPLDEMSAFVGTDNRQSVDLIVDYLCRSGEPPSYFDMPQVNNNSSTRRIAYEEAMRRLGREPLCLDVAKPARWDFERFAFDEASRLFERMGDLPSRTILCANDRIAFGVISAASQKGMKVGHGTGYDLRVAGHDDHPLSRYANPPITTVAQNYNEIGRLSIELLFQKLNEEAGQSTRIRDRILLSADLMLRKSA